MENKQIFMVEVVKTIIHELGTSGGLIVEYELKALD